MTTHLGMEQCGAEAERHGECLCEERASRPAYAIVVLGCGHPMTVSKWSFTKKFMCQVCYTPSRASTIRTVREINSAGGADVDWAPRPDRECEKCSS